MSSRLSAVFLLAGLVLPGAVDAADLNWTGSRLPNAPGQPFHWKLDARKATPAGIALAKVETSFKTAFDAWQAVDCAYLSFAFDGRVQQGARQGDGRNVFGTFIENRSEDDELYKNVFSGAVLAASMTYDYGGTIHECDVAFNAVDYGWATDGTASKLDLLSAALHETGHCLGLDHFANNPKAVMFPWLQPGELRHALVPHDEDNLCQLYPQSGGFGSPCGGGCPDPLACHESGATSYCTKGCDPASQPGDCPVGFSCTAGAPLQDKPGTCTLGGEGSTKVGYPCTDNPQCGTSADAKCAFNDAQWIFGYCSESCAAHPCPTGSTCRTMPDGAKWCLKTCRPGEDDCRPGYACSPHADGVYSCEPACASNAECYPNLCDACSGLCVAAGSAEGEVGDPCVDDSVCPFGTSCRRDIGGGICTRDCARCGACPQGSVCLPFGERSELLCFHECTSAADCGSEFGCWQEYRGSGCKPACGTDPDCPVGLLCVDGSCLGNAETPDCPLCPEPPVERVDAGYRPEKSEPLPTGCGCAPAAGDGFPLVALGLVVFAGRFARSRRLARPGTGRSPDARTP